MKQSHIHGSYCIKGHLKRKKKNTQAVSSLASRLSSAQDNYCGFFLWHNKYESTGGIHFQLFNWRNERSCNTESTQRICQAMLKTSNSHDLGVIKLLIRRKVFHDAEVKGIDFIKYNFIFHTNGENNSSQPSAEPGNIGVLGGNQYK